MKRSALIIVVFLLLGAKTQDDKTFMNPLLPSGADPWSIYHNGYYYYTHTLGNRLEIWKTKNLAELKSAERKIVWTPPANTNYSKQIWAPELHYIDSTWYMYFAADDGKNENHRIYSIFNRSKDPLIGDWKFFGKVSDPSDKWAIDASVFEVNKKLYMVWSGWEGDKDGAQNIYIASMKDPLTVSSKRVMISKPELSWETHGPLQRDGANINVSVNEGPQVLFHGQNVFLIYSASGCWTERYSLGMLSASASSDLLDPASWKKYSEPVFTASPSDSVFAPGHNSFFKSPDGKEDWILYHANAKPGQGCGRDRSPRAQPFTWSDDGIPVFGKPVSTKVAIEQPR
ncbi:MAG TPA: glycoside hydrolase family 43 protein [Chryseosolibacter sp.]